MRLIVVLFLLPILSIGQAVNNGSGRTSQILTTFRHINAETAESWPKLDAFIHDLSKKSGKDDHRLLEHLFYKTHARFLKRFAETTSFENLVNSGTYNCLTATALYALILESLDYRYQIVETNYHIFIIAETNKGKVLLETTDPVGGFVAHADEIEARTIKYINGAPGTNALAASTTSKVYHQYKNNLYNLLDVTHLTGLLHYNQSVRNYNEDKLELSVHHLQKARSYYNSQRIEEFSKVVLLTVIHSGLDPKAKEELVRKIQAVRFDKTPVIASLGNY